jgi:hypothetical protein
LTFKELDKPLGDIVSEKTDSYFEIKEIATNNGGEIRYDNLKA